VLTELVEFQMNRRRHTPDKYPDKVRQRRRGSNSSDGVCILVLALIAIHTGGLFECEHADMFTTRPRGDGCVHASLGPKLERARYDAAGEIFVGVTRPGIAASDAEYDELRSYSLR
jgi:hypothetical protein